MVVASVPRSQHISVTKDLHVTGSTQKLRISFSSDIGFREINVSVKIG